MENKTTLFTKNNCVKCDSTKAKFKELGVEYNEINIEKNPEWLVALKAQGFRSAPVVITPQGAWAGYNEAKILEVFGNRD